VNKFCIDVSFCRSVSLPFFDLTQAVKSARKEGRCKGYNQPHTHGVHFQTYGGYNQIPTWPAHYDVGRCWSEDVWRQADEVGKGVMKSGCGNVMMDPTSSQGPLSIASVREPFRDGWPEGVCSQPILFGTCQVPPVNA
jgi:hypothetical protein